ncbi:MAG: BspA family leucine-rich repeat surface protein, partial [Clostridia bacterium]|nr:BspA family leucine-rich repeat surface protein [Clostridia bacterium]
MKFNKIGSVQILNSAFTPKPNKVYVNGGALPEFATTINIAGLTEVKLEWDAPFASCKNMFKDLKDVLEMDLSNFDSSLVSDTSGMFQSCNQMTSLNLDNFDTSLVTTMVSMFQDNPYLKKLDIRHFDTSNVKDMSNMFFSCTNLTTLDLSNFNTEKVTSMGQMFKNCLSLQSLDLSNFKTSSVTSMYCLFSFNKQLSSLNIRGFDTQKVYHFSYMFESCYKLTSIDVSFFDLSSGSRFIGMFQTNSYLEVVNLTNFKSTKAYEMQNFFNGCTRLHTIVGLEYLDTRGAANLAHMFKNCQSLTSLDLSNFVTTNVKWMTNMFYNCRSLSSVKLSSFNTKNVEYMDFMFYNCHSLTSLEITNFKTGSLTRIESMFYNCTSLTSLDITNFDTSKVTSMNSMFEKCTGLTILNISNFYPSKCNEYKKMFSGCKKLEYVNFYNYYETNTTIFTDIIKDAFNEIQLCIHVTRKARIYLFYEDHLVEECLIQDETYKTTEEINQILLSTDKQAEENINPSTDKEIDIASTEEDTSQSIKNPDTTNKISEYSSGINENPIILSTPISESKSTSNIPHIINSINVDKTQEESTILISSDYMVLNDFYLFPGYNNTQIYNRIIENMIQSYLGNTNQKIYFKGENNFVFIITTEKNEMELLSERSINIHNTSMIDLGECKNLLKNRYYPNSNEYINFIILKHETVTNNPEEKIVQYEVYDLFNKTK